MDEGVPLRRAIIGFVLIAGFVVLVMALVRPAVFVLAPARDDAAVVIGTLTDVTARTERHEILLSRSYGWDGERDAGDGRVQLSVITGPTATGIAAVSGASPVTDDCEVDIAADRLTGCEGRSWTFEGLPIDSADPPLERWPIRVDDGAVVVDFTRTIDD